MEWGFTCSSEEFEASTLADLAVRAEDAGFEFVSVSDHFHPWTSRQGHSPHAWTTVGAIAALTSRVRIGTGVTCPLIRQHPAVVAQAAATAHELSSGRFFLGVGTGEALNENVVGAKWPRVEVRQAMLVEAVSIMQALWSGESVDIRGDYFACEKARLFSAPSAPIEVVWAASGTRSATLAARHADGLWCTHADPEVVNAYRRAGGNGKVIGQVTLCWHPDADAARLLAHARWPNAALGGQLSQELPHWTDIEAATLLARPDDVAARVVCGPDTGGVVDAVDRFVQAGVDAIHFHQVGDDQVGFLTWWTHELSRELGVS